MTKNQFQNDYVNMIESAIRTIDSLISEIETNAIHNPDLRNVSLEMAMDSVPLARCLRDAKRQAEITLSVYKK